MEALLIVVVFLSGLVAGGLLGFAVRVWSDGLPKGETSPPAATVGAPPSPEWGSVCVLVDGVDRVISYRQVKAVPGEFTKYHGRGANSRFVRDGEDAEGRPRFRLVG